MADVLFIIGGAILGILLFANLTVILARIAHKDNFAKRIVALSAHITWVFKLGSEDGMRHENGANGHLRA